MQTKRLLTAALLFTSTLLSASLQTDSLMLHTIPSINNPRISSPISENYINDSAIYLNEDWKRFQKINSSDDTFYDNLRKAAERRQTTKWLHELLVKDHRTDTIQVPDTEPQRSESQFEKHEGKIIREIKFRTVNLFAASIDEPHYSPGRLERIGMLLHFNTNNKILKNNLLFKTGDKIDPFILSDTERLLRQLSYLEDARIYVFENAFNPEYADIIVVTKDRWSHGLDMDLSEIDAGRIDFFDRNVLGLGQELKVNLLFDGREERVFGYNTELKINNIGRNFVQTGISYLNAFDNNIFHINSGRDFLTPSMKYAGGIEFTSAGLVDDYNFPDTSFINQKLEYHESDYWFGRSFLLSGKKDEKYLRNNIYITSRFNRSLFFERPGIDKNIRYDYHNRNLYLFNLSFTRMGFLKSKYIYGFGPTEDIPVGTKVKTTIGYEDNQFYSRTYAGFDISYSNFFNNIAYLRNSISAGSFINEGVREQGVIKFETSGFSNLLDINSFYLRQFFSLNFTKGIKRFEDELISISNRNGIRGLRSDMLKGTQKLTLQMETMLYAKNNWYGFKYALYSMADLGWIGQGDSMVINESFYSGFGLGLRVRNEHIVLPTIQFRFAWFPRVPESASTKLLYILTERKHVFDEYKVTAPAILPYR